MLGLKGIFSLSRVDAHPSASSLSKDIIVSMIPSDLDYAIRT